MFKFMLKHQRSMARAVAASCCIIAAGASSNANAIGLLAAYEAALKNDPTFRSAYFENEANQESKAIARSFLLPSLTSSYSAMQNRADTTSTGTNIFGQFGTTTTHPKYISRSANLSLRQPLVNFEATARYREALAQMSSSGAIFAGRTQDLVVRVVSAYFDALLATEQSALAAAQRDSFVEQSKVNERLFEKGEGSRTDMIETQAKVQLAEAVLIEARDNERTAVATLASIIGQDPGQLEPMAAGFKVKPGSMLSLDEWNKTALSNNPEIKSQKASIDMAREGINKGRAGHMPKVELVANLGKSAADTVATSNQENYVRSIGVQMSIPLYQGGYNSAVTRQATSTLERAKANLQVAIEKVLIEVRKEHALVNSTALRIEALEKAVESSKLLIKATEQSIKGGVRINLDLLNAQQQLYSSQRDYASARYGHLISGLRLRAAAGTLVFEDVREVAAYFR